MKVGGHNTAASLEALTVKLELTANDSIFGNMKPFKEDPQWPKKTMQLHSLLQLFAGLRCEISINIKTEDGLTDGTRYLL